MQHCLGKDKLKWLDEERIVLALINSLIYAREKDALEACNKIMIKSMIEFVKNSEYFF